VNTSPRVAFFTDTYDEINGVALTSRQFEAFARRRDYPFLCVRGGDRDDETCDQSLLLRRGWGSLTLDRGLQYDPCLWRHHGRVRAAIQRFRPDVIHVVSPGDVSQIGVAIAWEEKIPLVISWHTNLHQFGERRLRGLLQTLSVPGRDRICRLGERVMFSILAGFYRLGRVLYAPNQELIDMLVRTTGRPTFLMIRGVDTQMFHPSKRRVCDSTFRIGFVGRITPEKNVRLFAKIEQRLLARGMRDFRFVIVGDGSERDWLQRNLRYVELPGILRGEELAAAYAGLDIFLFPSRTDTFGNVVQEAMASGAPPIVTDQGGPKFIVRDGISGFVARNDDEMVDRIVELMMNRERLARMREAGLAQVALASWDRVFEDVYAGYATATGEKSPATGGRGIRLSPEAVRD
jgi:phosphatidylinositol alpha 1,6-mannosyltransferase